VPRAFVARIVYAVVARALGHRRKRIGYPARRPCARRYRWAAAAFDTAKSHNLRPFYASAGIAAPWRGFRGGSDNVLMMCYSVQLDAVVTPRIRGTQLVLL